MLKGINHITIAVKDLEKSFVFYKDVLGFKPLLKHSKGAYFLLGELWFCLDLDSNTRAEALSDYTHFAFDVDQSNFKAVTDKIISSGIKIWKANKSEGDSLYFLDPDGHKLEMHVGNWRTRIEAAKKSPWGDKMEFFV